MAVSFGCVTAADLRAMAASLPLTAESQHTDSRLITAAW